MTNVADALRKVTVAMQRAIESGDRSTRLDAEDLIQVLLAVADELDPPTRRELVDEPDACHGCGQRDPDMLVWQDDDTVRCASCGTEYQPTGDLNR